MSTSAPAKPSGIKPPTSRLARPSVTSKPASNGSSGINTIFGHSTHIYNILTVVQISLQERICLGYLMKVMPLKRNQVIQEFISFFFIYFCFVFLL